MDSKLNWALLLVSSLVAVAATLAVDGLVVPDLVKALPVYRLALACFVGSELVAVLYLYCLPAMRRRNLPAPVTLAMPLTVMAYVAVELFQLLLAGVTPLGLAVLFQLVATASFVILFLVYLAAGRAIAIDDRRDQQSETSYEALRLAARSLERSMRIGHWEEFAAATQMAQRIAERLEYSDRRSTGATAALDGQIAGLLSQAGELSRQTGARVASDLESLLKRLEPLILERNDLGRMSK
jgi:hypothetical protein